ncbi:MAG: aspartate carbamoyltransferase regulatory subunit [Anaerovoracaceae bacterium]|jgi:aspartate carbamoyltransferase regulatory subunit
MVIDSIKNGIVIDHIKAGRGMKLLSYLNIDNENDTVAIIMNAVSKKRGKKDIIKIENVNGNAVNMDVVGLIDPNATVNIIENEQIKAKIKPKLPARVENVIKCKNPRCVTSTERGIKNVFVLNDAEHSEYRCIYCDEVVSMDTE